MKAGREGGRRVEGRENGKGGGGRKVEGMEKGKGEGVRVEDREEGREES